MLLLDALVVSECNLCDLRVERLKPFDEQAVHHLGSTCGSLRFAIGERVALPPKAMDYSVAPPIELRQLIYERGNRVVLLLKIGSILFDKVVEAYILPLGNVEEEPEQGLDQCVDKKISLHELSASQGLCRGVLVILDDD